MGVVNSVYSVIMESGGVPSIESYIEAGDFTGLADHCEEVEIMVSLYSGIMGLICTDTGSSRGIVCGNIRKFTSSVPSTE